MPENKEPQYDLFGFTMPSQRRIKAYRVSWIQPCGKSVSVIIPAARKGQALRIKHDNHGVIKEIYDDDQV